MHTRTHTSTHPSSAHRLSSVLYLAVRCCTRACVRAYLYCAVYLSILLLCNQLREWAVAGFLTSPVLFSHFGLAVFGQPSPMLNVQIDRFQVEIFSISWIMYEPRLPKLCIYYIDAWWLFHEQRMHTSESWHAREMRQRNWFLNHSILLWVRLRQRGIPASSTRTSAEHVLCTVLCSFSWMRWIFHWRNNFSKYIEMGLISPNNLCRTFQLLNIPIFVIRPCLMIAPHTHSFRILSNINALWKHRRNEWLKKFLNAHNPYIHGRAVHDKLLGISFFFFVRLSLFADLSFSPDGRTWRDVSVWNIQNHLYIVWVYIRFSMHWIRARRFPRILRINRSFEPI